MSNEKENPTEVLSSDAEETSAIMELPPKMQRFIHLYTTGQYTLNKLAQLLEVHPNTLSNWLKRTDVKGIIAEMQTDIHDMVSVKLKLMTLKASDKMGDLLNSPIDGVALQAAKDILDRTGHKSKQEIKIDKTVTTIEQKMKELVEATIIDGEYEEVE